jgi:hypothetical protein
MRLNGQVGPMDAADSELMAYAAKHDYVVLTHDLDFSAIPIRRPGDEAQHSTDSRREPKPGGHRGAAHRGLATDDSRPCGRCAAYGRSGSHPTQPAATALQQTLVH